MHLIIDGYSSNSDILQSEEFIYQLLDQYPAEIGMTKIAPPYVLRYVGAKPEEWGVSGFVLIAEDFDANQTIKDLSGRLQLTEVKTYLLDRTVSPGYLDQMGKTALLQPQ